MYLSNYFIGMFCKYFVINFLIGLAKATFNNNKKKTKFIENFLTSASIFCLKKKKKTMFTIYLLSTGHSIVNTPNKNLILFTPWEG